MRKYISLENLIYSTVFFLPTYLIKLHFFFIHTNVLEILMVATLFWWWLFFYRKEKIQKFYLSYRRYVIAGVIMLAGLFLSTFFHGNPWQSIGIIKGWFLLPLTFMLVASDSMDKAKIKNIFFSYGWSTFFVANIALAYLFLGQSTYDGRLAAFFNSPNYLAMYLAPGIMIVSWRIMYDKRANALYINSFFLLVVLVALFFTRSYAAFIATFLGVLTILWSDYFLQRRKKTGWMIAIASTILLTFFAFQLSSEKLNNLIELNPRSSLASRVMIWQSSLQMIKDNPLFGIGPANFQEIYLEYQKFYPPYLEWAVPHPQNLYLTFWLSGGLLGLGGFLALMFFLGYDLAKNKNQNALNILVLGIVVYILAHGFFDTTYFKNDLSVIFWLGFLALK